MRHRLACLGPTLIRLEKGVRVRGQQTAVVTGEVITAILMAFVLETVVQSTVLFTLVSYGARQASPSEFPHGVEMPV